MLNQDITLHNVLHVPGFQFNLISVQKLCRVLNCQIFFTPDKCFIQDLCHRGQFVLLCNLKVGLYNFDDSHVSYPSVDVKCCSFSNVDNAKLGHLRLGHIPFDQISLVFSYCNAKSILHDIVCNVCPGARHTRKPFPKSSIKSAKAFEIFHIDVWGS